MVAGPKLKLSIFTSVPVAGLSLALTAALRLAPWAKVKAINIVPTNTKIPMIFFMFLSPLKYSLIVQGSTRSRQRGIDERQRVIALHVVHMRDAQHAAQLI